MIRLVLVMSGLSLFGGVVGKGLAATGPTGQL
jgi:hypothetical protein